MELQKIVANDSKYDEFVLEIKKKTVSIIDQVYISVLKSLNVKSGLYIELKYES